jgi:hypothetical protein
MHREPELFLVSLGCTYSGGSCSICGDRAEWGVASQKGPAGCVEAIKNGEIYCDKHLIK